MATHTVAEIVAAHAERNKGRFGPVCQHLGVAYPPPNLTLIALKEERQLELWCARGKLATYPILAASGTLGPKRREGDQQVPEGFYRLTVLNPMSRFHLSIRVDYPNAEDRAHATVPVAQLGSDIYVHGRAVSIGCIAIGDPAIEEVFTLVAQVGLKRSRILIAPRDLRTKPAPPTTDPWLTDLYGRLQRALRRYRA